MHRNSEGFAHLFLILIVVIGIGIISLLALQNNQLEQQPDSRFSPQNQHQHLHPLRRRLRLANQLQSRP